MWNTEHLAKLKIMTGNKNINKKSWHLLMSSVSNIDYHTPEMCDRKLVRKILDQIKSNE